MKIITVDPLSFPMQVYYDIAEIYALTEMLINKLTENKINGDAVEALRRISHDLTEGSVSEALQESLPGYPGRSKDE
jgi:hypothetical protein